MTLYNKKKKQHMESQRYTYRCLPVGFYLLWMLILYSRFARSASDTSVLTICGTCHKLLNNTRGDNFLSCKVISEVSNWISLYCSFIFRINFEQFWYFLSIILFSLNGAFLYLFKIMVAFCALNIIYVDV